MEKANFLVMCMIFEQSTQSVLVKKTTNGEVFPSYALERGMGIIPAAIAGCHRETGLTLDQFTPCGVVNRYFQITDTREVTFQFLVEAFTGTMTAKDCEWVSMHALPFRAWNDEMRHRLPMFLSGSVIEGYALDDAELTWVE